MKKRLVCLLRGHAPLCMQDYVLGKNVIMHKHVCLRCEKTKFFPEEPMSDELLSLLVSLVGQPGQAPEEPPTKHYMN